MIAVVVVRAGQLPAGGAEAIAECGGRTLLVGSELDLAVTDLADAIETYTVLLGGTLEHRDVLAGHRIEAGRLERRRLSRAGDDLDLRPLGQPRAGFCATVSQLTGH